MDKIKIRGTPFVRDPNSRVLINTDEAEREWYNSKVKAVKLEKEEINKVRSELDNVHKDMSEIKSLLLKLLEKASKGGGQVLRQEDGNTC